MTTMDKVVVAAAAEQDTSGDNSDAKLLLDFELPAVEYHHHDAKSKLNGGHQNGFQELSKKLEADGMGLCSDVKMIDREPFSSEPICFDSKIPFQVPGGSTHEGIPLAHDHDLESHLDRGCQDHLQLMADFENVSSTDVQLSEERSDEIVVDLSKESDLHSRYTEANDNNLKSEEQMHADNVTREACKREQITLKLDQIEPTELIELDKDRKEDDNIGDGVDWSTEMMKHVGRDEATDNCEHFLDTENPQESISWREKFVESCLVDTSVRLSDEEHASDRPTSSSLLDTNVGQFDREQVFGGNGRHELDSLDDGHGSQVVARNGDEKFQVLDNGHHNATKTERLGPKEHVLENLKSKNESVGQECRGDVQIIVDDRLNFEEDCRPSSSSEKSHPKEDNVGEIAEEMDSIENPCQEDQLVYIVGRETTSDADNSMADRDVEEMEAEDRRGYRREAKNADTDIDGVDKQVAAEMAAVATAAATDDTNDESSEKRIRQELFADNSKSDEKDERMEDASKDDVVIGSTSVGLTSPARDGDHDSGVDESTQRKMEESPTKSQSVAVGKTVISESKQKKKATQSGNSSMASTKKTLVSPSTASPARSLKSPSVPSSSSSKSSTPVPVVAEKKVPMNRIVVGTSAAPNLKVVKSKIGSMDNVKHKAGGGEIKVETKKIDLSTVKSKVGSTDNIQHKPTGGEKKVVSRKLEWKAESKVGSLENAAHKAGGGDKKIETQKLDFKDKAKPKVGSKDNIEHKAGGGAIRIEERKLTFKDTAKPKIGSLDNVTHKPGGGTIQIFDEKNYFRQQSSSSNRSQTEGSEGRQSPENQFHSPHPSDNSITSPELLSDGIIPGQRSSEF